MRKDRVVLDRETYESLRTLRDSTIDYYREYYEKYQDRYIHETEENKKLQKENGYLKALFDKEADTQVIKYNGKLYRMISVTNCIEPGIQETLDISLVLVSEVS